MKSAKIDEMIERLNRDAAKMSPEEFYNLVDEIAATINKLALENAKENKNQTA